MTEKKVKNIKVGSPFGRVSFPYLSQPKQKNPDKPGDKYGIDHYSLRLLIPKQDDSLAKDKSMKGLLVAIGEAHTKKFGTKVKMTADGHHFPIKDGKDEVADYLAKKKEAKEEPSESMLNMSKYWIISAKTGKQYPPTILNPMAKKMTNEEIKDYIEDDPTCWARISINVAAFDVGSSKGVTFYLKQLQYKCPVQEEDDKLISSQGSDFDVIEDSNWDKDTTSSTDSDNELDDLL